MPPPGAGPPPPPRASSLYVGGLDARVCTELLHDVFSLAGKVTLCRVVADKNSGASMGFGFVDYPDHATALKAQQMLHGRVIYGHELTVDWAHANSNAAAGRGHDRGAAHASGPGGVGASAGVGEDISNHYCLFIGNLDASVTDEDLRSAFSSFGQCSSAQVSRDASNQSRRCAFVSFKERSAAQAAIDGLNGQVIANRPMRVDWARTKTNAATRAAAMGLPDVDAIGASSAGASGGPGSSATAAGGASPGLVGPGASSGSGMGSLGGTARPFLDYPTVAGQTPPSFTTAYISGLPPSIDDATLRSAFESHGTVSDIRIPESARAHGGDKLYAFVVYADHECAARAIFEAQKGLVVAGRHVTVQWGRESSRPSQVNAAVRRPPPAIPMRAAAHSQLATGWQPTHPHASLSHQHGHVHPLSHPHAPSQPFGAPPPYAQHQHSQPQVPVGHAVAPSPHMPTSYSAAVAPGHYAHRSSAPVHHHPGQAPDPQQRVARPPY